MDFQGAQRQKEGQEEQGNVNELGGTPPLDVSRSTMP
jgi:hypothetical protein